MIRVSMTLKQLDEYAELHLMLHQLFKDVARLWMVEELHVTSIHRTATEDAQLGGSGVHAVGPPYRAMDIRTTNLGNNYMELAAAIGKAVNEKWVYDVSRPHLQVCVFKNHGDGPHMHLQVHSRTMWREQEA